MKFRAVASLALAAAVATGLAGCNLISPQSTTLSYNASDGVSVDLGALKLRNVLVLVGDADNGSLVLSAVNEDGSPATVNVSGAGTTGSFEVPGTVGITPIGFGEGAKVELAGTELEPGGAVELTFTSKGGTTATVSVPVLDGTLAEYASLAPTATVTAFPATPTPGESVAPTATP